MTRRLLVIEVEAEDERCGSCRHQKRITWSRDGRFPRIECLQFGGTSDGSRTVQCRNSEQRAREMGREAK